MLFPSFNAVYLIPLPLTCFGHCICFLLLTHSPPHFIFRIKHMVLPFSPESFNPTTFPALESCFDSQGKNTVIGLAGANKRCIHEPACSTELENGAWNHEHNCPLWPGPQRLQQVRAQVQRGTVYLQTIFHPSPLTSPISSGIIFIKWVVLTFHRSCNTLGKSGEIQGSSPRKILRST